MAAKFFGEFLLENDLVTQETLDQALEIHQLSGLMLGEIAVSLGILSELDAHRINKAQQHLNKRFGEIAVALGFLNQQQIDQILLIQRKQHKYIGICLVEVGFFSQEQITQQLQVYEREKQQECHIMSQSIAQHPLADYITAFIETTDRMFLRILLQQSQFSGIIEYADQLPPFEAVCQITAGEDDKMSFCIAAGKQTAVNIASIFTHQEIIDCDLEFSIDTLGEFLNIIVANLAEDIDEVNTSRSPPHFDLNLHELLSGAKQMLIVEMSSQIGNFLITVSRKI